MSDLKLTYYNLRGRGETARLILAQAGLQYEDERLELGGPRVAGQKADAELRYNQVTWNFFLYLFIALFFLLLPSLKCCLDC